MHFQHRNPSRERDHRISLMPMAHRTNAQGGSFVREPMAEPKSDTRFKLAVCAYMALITAGGIAASLYFSSPPPAASSTMPRSEAELPTTGSVEAAAGNRGQGR